MLQVNKYPITHIFCIEYAKVDSESPLLKDLQSIPYATSMIVDTHYYKLLGYDKRVYWTRIMKHVLKILKTYNLECT